MKNKVNDHLAKEKILKVAKSEFAKHGFQGSRMEKIAERAVVNKALIHYYFKSKEKLYEAVLSSSFGKMDHDSDVPVFMGEKNLTISQKVYLIVYIVVMSHFRASDNEMNDIILWEMAEGGNVLRKVHDEILKPRYEPIMKVIMDGIRNGEFEAKNVELVMIGLHTMVHGFKVEERRSLKATLFRFDDMKLTENDYLDFCLEYVFKMLSPIDHPLTIPGIPEDIIAYIDKLIDITRHKGFTGNILTQLLNLLAE